VSIGAWGALIAMVGATLCLIALLFVPDRLVSLGLIIAGMSCCFVGVRAARDDARGRH
jgi:hypothetical protein